MRFHVLIAVAAGACCYQALDHVAIKGGSDVQKAAVIKAVREADAVWQSPAFWNIVEKHTWIPGPNQSPMTGSAVRAALQNHRPSFEHYRLVAYYGWNIFTVLHSSASAESSCGTPIAIRRWPVPYPTLIDTVAHENTHVTKVGKEETCPFVDGDYTDLDLPWLVSYGIGDLTQCFSSSGGDEARTEACFEQVVNAKYACRTYDQCCLKAGTKVPAHIEEARKSCSKTCGELQAQCEWHR